MARNAKFSAAESMTAHIDKLVDPIGVATMTKHLSALTDQVGGPLAGINHAFKQADYVNSMLPSSIRMMLDFNRQIAQLADPFGMRRYAGFELLQQQSDLHRAFGAAGQMMEMSKQLADMHRPPAWFDNDSFKSLRESMASFGFARSAFDQLATFQKSAKAIQAAFGPQVEAAKLWQRRLDACAIPTLTFLAQPHTDPMGIFTAVEGDDGATVGWLREGRNGPRLTMASLTPAVDRGEPFEVECEVRCLVCEGEMLVTRSGHSWLGKKVRVRLDVAPICLDCLKQGGLDPDWWQGTLTRIADNRPMLRVIEGSHDGDGKPRGGLRLVPPPGDE